MIATAFAGGQQRAERNPSHLLVGNLARDDADHYLIEQRESLINAAGRHERQAFVGGSTQFQCAIIELPRHRESQLGQLVQPRYVLDIAGHISQGMIPTLHTRTHPVEVPPATS